MSAIAQQPDNINFLAPQTHKLLIKRLPNVVFFCTEVSIPSVSLPIANLPNQFVNLPVPGDHLVFSELQIQFIIDENMKNYEELFEWMVGLGFPDNFDQHRALTPSGRLHDGATGTGLLSEISLFVNTSKHNANREFIFEDAWPSNITDLRFTTTDLDVEYIVGTATFAYTKFRLRPV